LFGSTTDLRSQPRPSSADPRRRTYHGPPRKTHAWRAECAYQTAATDRCSGEQLQSLACETRRVGGLFDRRLLDQPKTGGGIHQFTKERDCSRVDGPFDGQTDRTVEGKVACSLDIPKIGKIGKIGRVGKLGLIGSSHSVHFRKSDCGRVIREVGSIRVCGGILRIVPLS